MFSEDSGNISQQGSVDSGSQNSTIVSSSSRVKTFFNFDPYELIDDTVSAVTQYITDALMSFTECLKGNRFTQDEANQISAKLQREISKSLAENADLFEMYLLRNIFNVPLNVDLGQNLNDDFQESSNLMESMMSSNMDISSIQSMNNELDAEIESLRAQIIERYQQYIDLCKRIQKNELEALYLEKLISRFDKIESILHSISQLPTEQAKLLCQKTEECLKKAQQINEAKQRSLNDSLALQKASFTFD